MSRPEIVLAIVASVLSPVLVYGVSRYWLGLSLWWPGTILVMALNMPMLVNLLRLLARP